MKSGPQNFQKGNYSELPVDLNRTSPRTEGHCVSPVLVGGKIPPSEWLRLRAEDAELVEKLADQMLSPRMTTVLS